MKHYIKSKAMADVELIAGDISEEKHCIKIVQQTMKEFGHFGSVAS
ncbi:hypothetical protein [Sphingobacterium sp. ML3W]|nr:hypothetical protein [Sphingobacterium sp. ML3W]